MKSPRTGVHIARKINGDLSEDRQVPYGKLNKQALACKLKNEHMVICFGKVAMGIMVNECGKNLKRLVLKTNNFDKILVEW